MPPEDDADELQASIPMTKLMLSARAPRRNRQKGSGIDFSMPLSSRTHALLTS